MIDLDLIRSISRNFTHSTPAPDLGFDLQKMADDSLEVLTNYTGLNAGQVPAAELVSRDEWVNINLESMKNVFGMIDSQLENRVGDRVSNKALSPVLQALAKGASGLMVSTEIGVMYSFMSQRVLGQVEASLFNDTDDIRLFFVSQNLKKATDNMDVDPEQFYHWVVLHELTHVYQFAGVPWLRDYLSDLMKTYLNNVEAKLDDSKMTKFPDIEQIQQALKGGGISALLQSPAQREHMEKIQAVMALIEGYAEHVMDAAGEQVLGDYKKLRDEMQSRRGSRGPVESFIMKLLGMEMKMRQYEDGRAFCNGVAENYGIKVLNSVWDQAENIPTGEEVANFELWVARVAPDAPRIAPVKVAAKPTPSIQEQVNNLSMSPEAENKLSEIEDEDYLRALIKGTPSAQRMKEMSKWLVRAETRGYVSQDGNDWVVTTAGRRRLAEILSQ